MSTVIFGTFSDRNEANQALIELEEANVSPNDFSIINRDQDVLIGVTDRELSELEVRKCFEQHSAEQIVVVAQDARTPAGGIV